ncbi:hypothetical protein [uncultured Propionivibrio sp.]|uniref:hypothetical protein n=1 Tax=uncultured Propionivibrio sp. TaxID=426737 RepID=UPI0029C03CB6|nr:hypothetical protein [uncultured Propionivibrio sp.]
MSISAISAYSGVINAGYTNRTNALIDSSATVLDQKSVSTSTVTISAEARQAAANDSTDALENYRLPNWMTSLLPSSTALNNGNGMTEKQTFRGNHSSEIAEYAGYLDGAWASSLKEQGIQSHEDYVSKVLHASGDNSTLQNAVVGKLLANPKAVELMGILGIDRPVVD